MRFIVASRGSVLLIGSVAVLAVAGGIVYAAIPDHAGVIHGCYAKTGLLRVIDPSVSNCNPNETPLNWGVIGPQGLPGPGTAAYAADSGLNPIALPATLVSLSLPTGNYVLSGKVIVLNQGTNTAQLSCQLHNGGELGGPSLLDLSETYLFPGATLPTPAGSIAALPLVGRVSLSGAGNATIGIVCTANDLSTFAQFANVHAVKVATLDQQ